MKLTTRVVAVAAAAALTVALPSAAHAGGKPEAAKTKAAAAQAAAAKKAAEARKKAEQARSSFAFPGAVTAVGADTVTVTRKERGVVVSRSFAVNGQTAVRRDGSRSSLSAVQVGDRVVVIGTRVNGVLTARKVLAQSAAKTAQPVPATPTATIVI